MSAPNRLLFIALAAVLLTLAAITGGYSTIVLTDIEQSLPRRVELLARELGKLDREVATLDQGLATLVAAPSSRQAREVQLLVDFVHARVGTASSLAETVHVSGAFRLNEVAAALAPVEAALAPLAAADDAVPADAAQSLAAVRRDFVPMVRLVRDEATNSAEMAAGAINRQAEKLLRFRTAALGVLAAGSLSMLVVIAMLYRQRLTALALRDSQERYRKLFEGSAAIMLLLDPAEQRVVDANHAAADFYGWPPEVLRGKAVSEINVMSDAERRAEIDRALSESRKHLYMRHARADGTVCDVEVNSQPLAIDGRDLMLCIVHDISGRRAAERKLFETEARYRKVVDATTQGFWFVAPLTGNTVDVNESLCHMLGYSREEILGRPISDFADGPDRAILTSKVESAPRTQHRLYEVTLTRKDGGKVLTRFNATTLRDSSGEMRGSYAFIEDITQQRAFERRLAESEGMLRSITANIPGVIYQWYERGDGSRGFHWVSPRALEILGLPQKDLERDWRVLTIHPEDVERWNVSIREAARTRSDWSFEGRFILPGGRVMWWRGLARPVAVSPEETVFNGIILDISHQKELEAELNENRRLLNLALEAGRVGVWDLDLEAGTVWFSPSWKAQLGYADDELDNSMAAWRSVIFPEDGDTALKLADDYLAGRVADFEALQRFRHRDGSTVYIRTRARAVQDEKTGKAVRLIGAHVDLTPQIKAQEQLAQANMQNVLILESTADGLFGVDRAGRITFANAACQRMLGFTEREMIDHDAHALTHHSRADGTPYPPEDCPVSRVLADNQRREQVDEVMWRKDGRSLPVEMSVAPMVAEKGAVGAIVSFRDTTERQKYKAELERSNVELEQFAYAASHDLQEPLRGVTSYLSLLKRRHGPALPEGAANYLDQAMESAMRMGSMIRDLLTYSRVSTRGQRLAPTEAGDCARAALANLRIAMAEAGAEVTLEGDMPRVLADAGQLTSLFQNLIGNAVKYRAPGRTPHVRLRVEATEADRWRFSVEDNGIGIDPAYQDRIFLPFQRLHGHDQYEGTGIGLAVCRKVVERHGGTLTVRSEPGQGSVFSFDLASAPAEAAGPEAPVPAAREPAPADA